MESIGRIALDTLKSATEAVIFELHESTTFTFDKKIKLKN
jgi:hypothetical protein